MSIPPPPPNVPPGGYVTPNAPRRSGPGCWLWGFLTCLVVVIIVAVIFATSLYTMTKTPSGKKFIGSLSSAMKGVSKVAECEQKMKDVHDAILRYHVRTGTYPPNLQALVPDYLDAPELHCQMDTDPSPAHLTFKYMRPAEGAPDTTPLLSFHWKYALDLDTQKQVSDMNVIMMLNGKIVSNQTQTTVTKGSTTTTTTSQSNSSSTTVSH